MSDRIRVLVADDDPVVRTAIRVMLEGAGFEVAGEAAGGRQAVERAAELAPDVILMDLMMPVMDGVEASRRIFRRKTDETTLRRRTDETTLARHPGVRILALTSLEADERVLAAIRAGVHGYVHKSASPEEIAAAVRDVHRGEVVLPAALSRDLLRQDAGVEATSETPPEDPPALRPPILRTKLYAPEVAPDLVSRDALLARLEAGRHLPLTLVSAPAGYGKTTLLGQWLETTDAPGVWLSLDETESEPRIFLEYLAAAVEGLYPGSCEELRALLGHGDLPSPAVLAGRLVNDLDGIESRFVLVLDDYHAITDPAIQEVVDFLIGWAQGFEPAFASAAYSHSVYKKLGVSGRRRAVARAKNLCRRRRFLGR